MCYAKTSCTEIGDISYKTTTLIIGKSGKIANLIIYQIFIITCLSVIDFQPFRDAIGSLCVAHWLFDPLARYKCIKQAYIIILRLRL